MDTKPAPPRPSAKGLLIAFLAGAGIAAWLLAMLPESDAAAPSSGRETQGAPQPARRIVCASPALTEIVFSLGAGERVVGVSDFVTAPAEALEKPSVGGAYNPNKERIVALEPDLVLAQGTPETLERLCEENGIRLLAPELDTLADLFAAIRTVGAALELPSNATALVAAIETDLDAVREMAGELPPRSVFLSVGRPAGRLESLMTAGPGTFVHELAVLAGGTNVFGDVENLYPTIGKASLVARDPDLILEIVPRELEPGTADSLREDWQRMGQLRAVREGRIRIVGGAHLLVPGPRIGKSALAFFRALHPELYPEGATP